MKIKFTGGQPQLFNRPWSNSVPSIPRVERAFTQNEAIDYLLWMVTEMSKEIGELKARLAAFGDAED